MDILIAVLCWYGIIIGLNGIKKALGLKQISLLDPIYYVWDLLHLRKHETVYRNEPKGGDGE